ncbi:hypothetical protein GCM10027594_05110 [Hymenobacter agri]
MRLDGVTVRYFNEKLPGENDIRVLCDKITDLTGAYFHSLGNMPRHE